MEEIEMDKYQSSSIEDESFQKTNALLRGSRLIGNINVTCDLELSGDVEGNITSDKKCDIIIKGNCKGSINTKEGNVDIRGQMSNGDIIAGGDIKITGKFNGGKAEAKGKLYIDGKFNGKLQGSDVEIGPNAQGNKLQGSDVEIGPNAQGNGEILYTESISIAKGANVKVHIDKFQAEHEKGKKAAENKVIDFEFPIKKKRGIK
jgi:cytoskeletal protein CcmA (bactofilin family)